MTNRKKFFIACLAIFGILVIVLVCNVFFSSNQGDEDINTQTQESISTTGETSIVTETSSDPKSVTVYNCDVQSLNINTAIMIEKNGVQFREIRGNYFRIVTDPLTMYNVENQRVAYADDSYHLIAQDSHSIFVNNTLSVEMVGKFELFGEEYEFYDSNANLIAKADFDFTNTSGKLYGTDGRLMAEFESLLFFNDYKVTIMDDCTLDEDTILMIFASYYSDQQVDKTS